MVWRFTHLLLLAEVSTDIATAAPIFKVTNLSRSDSGSMVLAWTAETNCFTNLFFHVERASDLRSNFTSISPAISETSSFSFTDSPASAAIGFYRVSASPAFTSLNQSGAFSAVAATNVNGLTTAGYAGAIFDGR